MAQKCLELDKENPDCWLAYGAILGTYSLVSGIFDTLTHLDEVLTAIKRAYTFSGKRTLIYTPEGNNTKTLSLLGLSEFYRLCPDLWIVKLLTGVRGDKIKAYNYAKQLPIISKTNANARARATICAGAVNKDHKLIKEGISIIKKGLEFEILHPEAIRTQKRLLAANAQLNSSEEKDFEFYYSVGCVEFGNHRESN